MPMKKYVKISGFHSPVLIGSRAGILDAANVAPMGIPAKPASEIVRPRLEAGTGFEYLGGISLPARSTADRNVAKASAAHCTGHTVIGDGDGVVMQAESYLELCNLQLLNAKLNVTSLKEQVRFTFGFHKLRQQEHVFDVVADLENGDRIAFAVKPTVRLRSGRFLSEMQTVAWWVRERGFADEVRIISEADFSPTDQKNAAIFAAVRGSDPAADEAARRVAENIPSSRSRSLRALTIETGLEARGYRALLRLVRSGVLVTPGHLVLTPNAAVMKAADCTYAAQLTRQRRLVANTTIPGGPVAGGVS